MDEQAGRTGWWKNPVTRLKQLEIGYKPFKYTYDIVDEAGQVVLAADTPLYNGTVFEGRVGKRTQLFLSVEAAKAFGRKQQQVQQLEAVPHQALHAAAAGLGPVPSLPALVATHAAAAGGLVPAQQNMLSLSRSLKRTLKQARACLGTMQRLQGGDMVAGSMPLVPAAKRPKHEQPLPRFGGAAAADVSTGRTTEPLSPALLSPAVQYSTGMEGPMEYKQQQDDDAMDLAMPVPDSTPADAAADQPSVPTYSSSEPASSLGVSTGTWGTGRPSQGMGFGSAKQEQFLEPNFFGLHSTAAAAAAAAGRKTVPSSQAEPTAAAGVSSGQRPAPRQRKRWDRPLRDKNAPCPSDFSETGLGNDEDDPSSPAAAHSPHSSSEHGNPLRADSQDFSDLFTADKAAACSPKAAHPTHSSSEPGRGSLLCAGNLFQGLDMPPAKLDQAIEPLFTALTVHEASKTPVEPELGHFWGSFNSFNSNNSNNRSSSSMPVQHGGLLNQQLQPGTFSTVLQEQSPQSHEQLDLPPQLPADSSMGFKAPGQAAGNSSGLRRQRARWGKPIYLAATLQARDAASLSVLPEPGIAAAGRTSKGVPAARRSTVQPSQSKGVHAAAAAGSKNAPAGRLSMWATAAAASSSARAVVQQRTQDAVSKHYIRMQQQKNQPTGVWPELSGSLGDGSSSSSSRTSRAMGGVSTNNFSKLSSSSRIGHQPKITQFGGPSSTSGAVSTGMQHPWSMPHSPSAADHPWLGGHPQQSAAAQPAAEAGMTYQYTEEEMAGPLGDPGTDAAAQPNGNPQQSAAAQAAAEAACSYECMQQEVGGDPGADAAAAGADQGTVSDEVQERVLGATQGAGGGRTSRKKWRVSRAPQAAAAAAAAAAGDENYGKDNCF